MISEYTKVFVIGWPKKADYLMWRDHHVWARRSAEPVYLPGDCIPCCLWNNNNYNKIHFVPWALGCPDFLYRSLSLCTERQCSTKACRRLKSLLHGRQNLFFGFTISHLGGLGRLLVALRGVTGAASGVSVNWKDNNLKSELLTSDWQTLYYYW